MPQVAEKTAVYHLQHGALGIGEDHMQSAGRDLVVSLINQGVVKQLFLELYGVLHNAAILNAWNQLAQGIETEKAISGLQTAIEDALAGLPDWPTNATPIKSVIATAMLRKIPVYCGDHEYLTKPQRRYFGDFETRHAHIRQVFQSATNTLHKKPYAYGPHAVGCLFLWGAAHFDNEDHPLDKYILGLPYIKKG